jgi:1,2-diacylglycerol 3-alpha-glucosyltransferase
MLRVAIVYHYFAHYRKPIIKVLQSSNAVTYDFFSDLENNKGVKVYKPEKQFTRIENKIFFSSFIWQKGIIRHVLNGDYDAVILLGDFKILSNWIVMLIMKIRRRQAYLWTHGLLQDEHGLKWVLRKLFYKMSSGLFLYGERSKKLLIDKGFQENKLHVIYNSLDLEQQRKYVVEQNIKQIKESLFSKDILQVVYSARLKTSRLNGIKSLIRTIDEINKFSNKKLHLVVVGDGEIKDDLLEYSHRFSDAIVTFEGAIYDEDTLSNIFKDSYCCIMPDDIGLSAIHSLGYYTAVLTHNNMDHHKPEVEILSRNVTGFFYCAEDKNGLLNILHSITSKNIYADNFFSEVDKMLSTKYNPNRQVEIMEKVIG